MVEILAMATAITAVTSGVVQAIKMTELVDKRYMPLVAIIVGMLLGLLATFMDIDLISRLWAGGISGLAATGLFELSKNTVDRE